MNIKKNYIIIIYLLFVIFFITSCINKQPETIDGFLKQNHTEISASSYNFNLLDSDIVKNDVILAGEGHAVAENFNIKFQLLKYLNKKYNIKYLLVELGYSSSCYINQYLKSGDEKYLKIVYANLKGTLDYCTESYNFWINLRNYNLTIPKNRRIQAVGIDIEHQIDTAYDYLLSIIPNYAPPNKIMSYIESLKNLKGSNNSLYFNNYNQVYDCKSFFISLKNNMKTNTSIYNKYFRSNYFDFSIIIDNIINAISAYTAPALDFNKVREPCIYNNFKRIYNHISGGKYFGEFGMEHVYQKTIDNQSKFATFLNGNDSPVKNKVLSIAYDYENCLNLKTDDKTNSYVQIETNSDITNNDLLNKYSKSDLTLFKLNGIHSPFNNKLYFVKKTSGGYTTDYFQYIILLKNSKAATPLEK